MSLPLQNDKQPLSSPSKSSLRRTSGTGSIRNPSSNAPNLGPTTHFATEATQHRFLPHSPPNQNLDYDEDEDEAAVYDDSASYQTAPQPQQPFQPFFTLIEDTLTNEHYHPSIHYIFADDEPDIITEAACRSLDQNSDDSPSQEQGQGHDVDDPEPRLPPPRPGIREHYLVLDIHPSPAAGPSSQQQLSDRLPSPSPSSVATAQALAKAYPYTVATAQSLSADWQVLRTSITDAPTMNAEQQHPDDHHLMLRVEGRGTSPDKAFQAREGETMEDMVEHFQTKLAQIRHLMVDLEVQDGLQGQRAEEEGDMFTQGGLVGIGFQPTGFGNAVLDEQD
ncbi:hypothetical protein LTR70_009906 [Exophiala xenobiotica]|uniref:Uncharacterized protein n=1 Tax=Lithohypha guttulata TaxID=1690604 RepID=A0ABR0JVZ0_9EURO|nr:hypothetical protein LTR24_009780 [Lithohypha guttulata]KAK5309880.1 hypothetical protein LTR70_009906 [Exophiala xenobiotica]